ncbi:hypothetical protein PTKIN_Ptkin01aG0385500 [Pterospermum kingtungense]
MWRRVIIEKYGGNGDSLLFEIYNFRHFSGMWRNITRPLVIVDDFVNTLLSGMGFFLCNGERILFWLHEWIPDTILRISFPRIFALAINKEGKVKDYGRMVNETWEWIIVLRRAIFDWERSQSFYEEYCKAELACPNDWKSVWAGLLPPKVELFCWKVIKGRVVVKTKLAARNVLRGSNLNCSLCGLTEESVDHFFSVSSSLKIWTLALGDICWTIWLKRNEVIFNRKNFNLEIAIDLVRFRMTSLVKAKWSNSCDVIMDLVKDLTVCVPPLQIAKTRPMVCWEKPPLSVLKFNVDGSSLGNPGPSSIGGLLRDHLGKLLITFSKPIGVSDSNMAEVMAVREAMLLFVTSRWVVDHALILELIRKIP